VASLNEGEASDKEFVTFIVLLNSIFSSISDYKLFSQPT